MRLGHLIAARRKVEGVSVEALAQDLGISRDRLSHLMNDTNVPGHLVPRIMERLKLSIAEVVEAMNAEERISAAEFLLSPEIRSRLLAPLLPLSPEDQERALEGLLDLIGRGFAEGPGPR